jgi:hypothetical protein
VAATTRGQQEEPGASGRDLHTVEEPNGSEQGPAEDTQGGAPGEDVRWDERLILELPPDADKEEVDT